LLAPEERETRARSHPECVLDIFPPKAKEPALENAGSSLK
jgi:hypothetical protein